jgi:hypothetical protein
MSNSERPPNLLLLCACLAHDDSAASAAFDRWQRIFDLDDIDGGGFVLLPLLEQRLHRLGIEHPWRGRLQGVVRKARLQRALDRSAAHAAQRMLQSAGIDAAQIDAPFEIPLLLDEIALYVVPRRAREARAALTTASGWVEQRHGAAWRNLRPLRWRSGVALRNADDRRMTLRWQLLDARPSPTIDAEMRARASREATPHPIMRFDPADILVQAALRRPTSSCSVALACIAHRHCDGAGLERARRTAAELDAHDVLERVLATCRAINDADPSAQIPALPPLMRLREGVRRGHAYLTANDEFTHEH